MRSSSIRVVFFVRESLILFCSPPVHAQGPDASIAGTDLEAEIRRVFDPDQLLTPDDVRGSASTLRGAVRNEEWPRLSAARGQVMLVLDETGRTLDAYRSGHPSLRGRAMFADAPENSPEGAVRIVNQPIEQGKYIRTLVKDGYIVRTRADANTVEARRERHGGGTLRLRVGLTSSVLTTTSPIRTSTPAMRSPSPVGPPGRCNPVAAPADCTDAQIR